MYSETTVHAGNSILEVEDNYRIHIDRQAIQDSVSTPPLPNIRMSRPFGKGGISQQMGLARTVFITLAKKARYPYGLDVIPFQPMLPCAFLAAVTAVCVVQTHIFRGDLTDVSARTKTVRTSPSCWEIPPLPTDAMSVRTWYVSVPPTASLCMPCASSTCSHPAFCARSRSTRYLSRISFVIATSCCTTAMLF